MVKACAAYNIKENSSKHILKYNPTIENMSCADVTNCCSNVLVSKINPAYIQISKLGLFHGCNCVHHAHIYMIDSLTINKEQQRHNWLFPTLRNKPSPFASTFPSPSFMVPASRSLRPSCRTMCDVTRTAPGVLTGAKYVVFRLTVM